MHCSGNILINLIVLPNFCKLELKFARNVLAYNFIFSLRSMISGTKDVFQLTVYKAAKRIYW